MDYSTVIKTITGIDFEQIKRANPTVELFGVQLITSRKTVWLPKILDLAGSTGHPRFSYDSIPL
jgi:hypothetical protein